MFPIHINDGTKELPNDDICYIIAKEGIFLKKNMGIMESIAPVKNISILESIQAAARMNIKKIPGSQFARVIAFFKEVYRQYYGESIVLLFYDLERKIYKIVPPHQKVSGAACDYNKGISIEGMQMIGTIHSHASMSAFHSGTDDKDEEHFDGLHITIGNVNQNDVSITASIVANGHRFVVKPEEYIERLVKTVDIDETDQKPTRRIFKWQNGKMVEDVQATSKFVFSYRKYDKRYIVDVSDRYQKVIPKWMEMVEKGSYPVYHFGYGGFDYGGMYGPLGGEIGKSWGKNYDSSLWKHISNTPRIQGISPNQVKPLSPLNVGPSSTITPIQFPPHDIEIDGDENIPCSTCVFRTYKFLQEQAGDEDPEVYKCEKCGNLIVDDTDAEMLPICQTCKTDEHLVLVAEDALLDNYVGEKEYDHLKKEPGIIENSSFHKCRVCGYTFSKFSNDTVCPICFTVSDDIGAIEEDDAVNTEELRTDMIRTDSGEYLSSETREVAEAALEEVKRMTQIIDRIPDPAENIIPIPEKREVPGFFKHFFKRGDEKK